MALKILLVHNHYASIGGESRVFQLEKQALEQVLGKENVKVYEVGSPRFPLSLVFSIFFSFRHYWMFIGLFVQKISTSSMFTISFRFYRPVFFLQQSRQAPKPFNACTITVGGASMVIFSGITSLVPFVLTKVRCALASSTVVTGIQNYSRS